MESARARILVVDDEPELSGLLQRYLGAQGYTVRAAGDGAAAQRLLARERYDVMVLDLMLPGEDGLSICRRLRAQGETLPIVMLTARGDPVDRVIGLEMGADDYLAKPFNPRELLARIEALLRRQRMLGVRPAPLIETPVRFGPWLLHPAERWLRRGDEAVALSSGEFGLLKVLVQNPHRPLGRERLIELVWNGSRAISERAVDVQILRLRRLIEADPAAPRYIQTVRGMGYVFVPDTELPPS